MKWLRKLVGVACLFAGFAGNGWGQSSGANAVNVVLYTGLVVGSTRVLSSGNLQNIGQTSHALVINAVPLSAVGSNSLFASIQGSIDGVNWVNIGPIQSLTLTDTGVGQTIMVSGFQYYPYLRSYISLTIAGGDTFSVSAQYLGNSSPSHNVVDSSGPDDGQIISTISVNAGMSGTVTALTAASPSTSAFLLNSVGPFVYGLTLNIASTVTAISIGCGTNGSGTISTTLMNLNTLGAAQTLIWPSSQRAILNCSGGQLYLDATGSGTGAVSGTIAYRFE